MPNRWARAPFPQPAPPGGSHALGHQEAVGLHPRLAQGKKASHCRGHQGVNTHPGVPSGPRVQVRPSTVQWGHGWGARKGRTLARASGHAQGLSGHSQWEAGPSPVAFSTVDRCRRGGFPEAAGLKGIDPQHSPQRPGQGLSHPTPAPVLPARSEVPPGRAPAHLRRPGLALAAWPSWVDRGRDLPARTNCSSEHTARRPSVHGGAWAGRGPQPWLPWEEPQGSCPTSKPVSPTVGQASVFLTGSLRPALSAQVRPGGSQL